jgi:hypothetical protein
MSKFIVTKSEFGSDRVSTSYLVDRANRIGKSVGGKFRFAKTSMDESAHFRTKETAQRVMRSAKRNEYCTLGCDYKIREVM